MKKLITIIAFLSLFTAIRASAESIPAFPMAFWGNVTINGSSAPIDTVIRAYYGDTLAGQVVVKEAGVYGYDSPTGQKLLVGEGTGEIVFKFQSVSFNNNNETAGTASQSHSAFVSGETIHKDLSFSIEIPAPAPQSSGGGGGGGGGSSGGSSGGSGSGGGSYIPPTSSSLSPAAQKVDANKDNKIDVLDFNILMVNWGKTGTDNIADFNQDGKIDIFDFNLLMINWTKI